MKFYRLTEDMTILNKWYLSEINDVSYIEQWGFTTEPLFEISSALDIHIAEPGERNDYTENLTYNVPILSNKAKSIFSKYDVSFSPINVYDLSDEKIGEYYAMGVPIIECVNELESEFVKYQINDPIRPDKAGFYKRFYNLVLSENKIKNMDIFRIEKYTIYLIVSERVKEDIEKAKLKGVCFEEVNVM